MSVPAQCHRWEAHPVRKLFDAGVPITFNTDDPAMFKTSLEREYEIAAERFGFSDAELQQIADNGFRYGMICYPKKSA